MLFVDRKQQGYFSENDLVILLSSYKFDIDKQSELLEAFRELDHDADGFVPRDQMIKYMTSMGEPLEQFEINYMMELAQQEGGDPNLIDIEKLAQILIPSDNIMDDLAREADEQIKKEDAENKARLAALEKSKESIDLIDSSTIN